MLLLDAILLKKLKKKKKQGYRQPVLDLGLLEYSDCKTWDAEAMVVSFRIQ